MHNPQKLQTFWIRLSGRKETVAVRAIRHPPLKSAAAAGLSMRVAISAEADILDASAII
jgi:hypothetical protein